MEQNLIENTIKNHIKNKNDVFVFPTQTAADLWADRITNPDISDVSAVAMERFIAWDDFKGNSIKTQQKDKQSIPSVLRKIFAENLIFDNSINPFLKSIIPEPYAKSGSSFSDWIASLLPSLSLWYEHFSSPKNKSAKAPDSEDEDFLELYTRYKAFLENHQLFDPAWEKPPFKSDENHYFIFFPEILSDYSEYKLLLESSPNDITLIHLPETNVFTPSVDFFDNSRTEIKNMALYLRKLHSEKKIPWDDFCVSIPDFDSYGPYVSRELELYEIPHVTRFSKPLSSSGAGNLFLQISNCVSSGFNYESIKTLLFNKELPWKNPELNNELIAFGQANNCICSFVYKNQKVDVWEKSFSDQHESENLVNYYRALKKHLTDFTNAQSFSKLREQYFIFRELFFNMDECPERTDRLISRCIAELGGLIDIERDYPECTVPSAYKFFLKQLDNTSYLEQTELRGVQLLPYKTAACAPFGCHIILDSSQSSLAVIYKQLNFLREDKRKELLGNKEDPNVTDFFIQLYAMNSTSGTYYFSAASKTFSGYAQSSSYLIENDLTKSTNELFTNDPYKKEEKYLLSGYSNDDYLNDNNLTELTQLQKTGFFFWKQNTSISPESKKSTFEELQKKLEEKRYENGKIRISSTHLKYFFKCQRQWFLHYIVSLQSHTNEAQLIDSFAIGNLYHKILELYCKGLIADKNNIKYIHQENNDLTDEYKSILYKCIDEACNSKKNSYLPRQLIQTTKEAITKVILNNIVQFSTTFEGYSVYGSELELKYEIPEKNIICEGFVDCLLQNPTDGSFVLIDFKTSDSSIPKNLYYEPATLGKKEVIPDFQMPMYIYLLKNQPKPIEVDECYFFNITNPKTVSVVLDEFQPTLDKLLECIDIYAEELSSGNCITNSQDDVRICNGCDYRALCRKSFTVGKLEK